MPDKQQIESFIKNLIRTLKGKKREQIALSIGSACLLAGYAVGGKLLPTWKSELPDVLQGTLYFVGIIALGYYAYRIWRMNQAPDTPEIKDRPSAIKGPSAFTTGDGELFRRLGRESELRELMGYVLDNQTPLVVLMGESGAGKTSLLRAGLPHILQGKAKVHYWEAVPTDSAERLLRAIQEDWSANGKKKPAELADLINPSAEALGAEAHVIVLDQFEQLRGRNAVLQFLRRVARESLPPHRLTWVVAFRREYADNWFDFILPEHKRGFHPKEMSLRLFSADAARDVISQLIQEAGLQVEQPVVNNLIEAAANADNQVSPVDIGIGLLVLSELHERLGGRMLTVKDYQFAGGAEGLLTQYINRCLERFAETEREPLLKALLALRNPETYQRLAEGLPLDQLAAEAAADPRRLQPQLERLAQRDIRLLEMVTPKNEGKDGATHYRLPHERLIPALHRLTGKLLGEIEQARLRFENAFLAWQKNDKRGHYLLKGKDLKLIERNASQMPWGSAEQEKQTYLRQSLRRRSFVRMGAVTLVIALVAVGWMGALTYQRFEHRRYLSESGYPPELYDYQHQLKNLTLTEPLDLERFTWLSSESLEELEIHATKLTTDLDGLSTLSMCNSLKRLKLDLSDSQVVSLEPLAKLSRLTQLELNLFRSKVSDLKPLAKLSRLKQLSLNLVGSQVNSLEPLTKLNELTEFTVDHRSDSVSSLEPLTTLSALTQLTLIQNAEAENLESLARLSGLTRLSLDLHQSRVTSLESLSKLTKLTQLSLNLRDSQVSSLAPLAKLSNLVELTLTLSESQVESIEPLATLARLTKLTLYLFKGQVRDIEPLTNLSRLTELTLNLMDGKVGELEVLEKLNGLQRLTVIHNHISSLEPIAKLNGLKQLILGLSGSQVSSLDPLANLRELTELSLDLSQTRVSSLEPLAKMRWLTHLTLTPQDKETKSLDVLSTLTNLTQLSLDLSLSQVNSLEPLTRWPELTRLSLGLLRSQVSSLEPVTKLNNLTQLTLTLSGTQVKSLEPLAKLNGLTEVWLDLLQSQVNSLEPLTKLPNLRTLSVRESTKAQRRLFQKIPASLVELRFLN